MRTGSILYIKIRKTGKKEGAAIGMILISKDTGAGA